MLKLLVESQRRDGKSVAIAPLKEREVRSDNKGSSSELFEVENLLRMIHSQQELMSSFPVDRWGRIALYAPKGKSLSLCYEPRKNTFLFWDWSGEGTGSIFDLNDDRNGRKGSKPKERIMRLIESGMTVREIETNLVILTRKKLLESLDLDLLWKSLFTDHFFE